MKITKYVLTLLTWDVFQIIVDIHSLNVNACMFNQSHGHWLFSNSLYAIITMALKLKEKFGMALSITNLMEDEYVYEFGIAYVVFQHQKVSM